MIAIPAVDLRDGACVQLVGGEFANEKVRLPNPPVVARDWLLQGFQRLHVVDLDAALGKGNNMKIVREILRESTVPVQVGGGIRSEDQIDRLIDDGATYVVVGTRAVEDESWLEEMAGKFPHQLIVAADVRERKIVTRGWTKVLPHNVVHYVEELSALPLAGILVTAVHKEGQLEGTDLPLMEDVAEASAWPVFASGGVSSMDDLRALEHRGLAGAVLGMALYTGAIDARLVAQEFES
ncbi:MAG: 1-(5-phosphoribosyl)-5-[(5-phosphoribosylamino)methylideneamino] imidazole-4-carboxamide isomerase [Phycisphaerae bacterium]|nr:1-(5-phosphoribosyl)-5-[(5-phosphoribosylamino)methylideneamino] imidazole-4-carboxamide isomerase [Gemmatimonadaceae bacterium]